MPDQPDCKSDLRNSPTEIETPETNVARLYLAGAVVAGRNTNRIFIENGRFHGEVIVKDICRMLGRKIAPFTNTTADARR